MAQVGLPSCKLLVQSPFVQAMDGRYCAVLPTANGDQYATSHCKPLLVWFPCKRRYINVRTVKPLTHL